MTTKEDWASKFVWAEDDVEESGKQVKVAGLTATIKNGEWSGPPSLVADIYKAMNPEWEYLIGPNDDPDLFIAERIASHFSGEVVSEHVYGRDVGMLYIEKADEKRYTFGIVYKATPSTATTSKELVLDAHQEYITDGELFDALEKYVESGDRNIYLQHSRTSQHANKPAGKWTQIVQWPYDVEMKVSHPGATEKAVKVPANSVFMGVKWNEWAWPLVKEGRIRGLSLGGYAARIPTTLA